MIQSETASAKLAQPEGLPSLDIDLILPGTAENITGPVCWVFAGVLVILAAN